MPGLDPGIHSMTVAIVLQRYGMDAMVEPWHDEKF
jgi:hypothetical protein